MNSQSLSTSADEQHIFAVVVLYQMSPDQSPAICSLSRLLEAHPELAAVFDGMIYDNSPGPHAPPPALTHWRYVHDGTNPGLSRPYQLALDQAQKKGFAWLLLLDQDTQVTADYLSEAVLVVNDVEGDSTVAAIVPRLLQQGTLLSPHWPIGHAAVPMQLAPGIYEEEVKVYNSGSLLRVNSLLAIGGIPKDFPLDYLDHAIYRQLQKRGGRVYQLEAALKHELGSRHSNLVIDLASSARLQSIVAAESRYYKKYGSFREILRHNLSRIRVMFRMILAGRLDSASKLFKVTVSEQLGWQSRNSNAR